MIQCVYEELGNKESAREASEAIQHIAQHVNLQEKRYLNQSIIGVSMGMRPPANVNTSAVNVNLLQPNVNTSSVNVNMNQPTNVNQSSVNVNLNQPTQPVNVNESSVNVNLNPPNRPVNVNESSVNVDLGPQAKNQNWVANSKKVDIQNSNVNIKLWSYHLIHDKLSKLSTVDYFSVYSHKILNYLQYISDDLVLQFVCMNPRYIGLEYVFTHLC